MSMPYSQELGSLEVPAQLSVLRRLSAWAEEKAAAWHVPEDVLQRLDLCLNELVANSITHGGPQVQQAALALQLAMASSCDQTLLTLSITDSGKAFDPSTAAPKARAASLAEATPGGLGLLMVQQSATRLVYRRLAGSAGRNQIDVLFQFESQRSAKSVPFALRHGQQDRRRQDLGGPVQRSGRDRRVRDLSWIPLFKDAPPAAIEAVFQRCELLEVPPSTPLLVPGQLNRSIYIALSGVVVAHPAQQGPVAVTIAPGQCIGELSAIDGKPVSTLVMTRSKVRLIRLPRELFWGELMALNGVAENFSIFLSDRVRKSKDLALQAQRSQLEVEHLNKELRIARQLQISMVPLQRPMFGHRSDLDVCGFMEPASVVGGDFFDAFFVREHQLFFCIADVSGHGIASALFMARAMGLIRVLAMANPQPHALLSELNARLAEGNEANLFVTMFCGMLDVPSRRLRYSNGGHCAPMIVSQGRSRMLPIPKGPLVGVFPGCHYRSMDITLAHDETLFCYTDGVTEAHDPQGQQFSEQRCLQFLDRLPQQPAGDMLDQVRQAVAQFSGTKVLEDDCTMLAIRLP